MNRFNSLFFITFFIFLCFSFSSETKADVIFLLDNSGSISDVEFATLIKSSKKVVEGMENVFPGGVHIGLVMFGIEATVGLHLNGNSQTVLNSFNFLLENCEYGSCTNRPELPYGGATYYSRAFKTVEEEFIEYGRETVIKIVYFLTDGAPLDSFCCENMEYSEIYVSRIDGRTVWKDSNGKCASSGNYTKLNCFYGGAQHSADLIKNRFNSLLISIGIDSNTWTYSNPLYRNVLIGIASYECLYFSLSSITEEEFDTISDQLSIIPKYAHSYPLYNDTSSCSVCKNPKLKFPYCQSCIDSRFDPTKNCDELLPVQVFFNYAVIILPIGIACVVLFTCLVVIILFLIFTVLRLCKKANKFNHIEGVDMILKEAELEQQQFKKTPNFTIMKSSVIVPYREIKIVKEIGSGASRSVVYLAKWREETVAYKAFNSSLVNNFDFAEFETEVAVCANVNHPSILQFFGACVNPPKVGLILEYAENGDIPSFFSKYSSINDGKNYPIPKKIKILGEIVAGMEYLHSRKFIHRDLKPENVLIDRKEKAKIMDFGLAKLTKNSDETMTKQIGTSYYMSPEVIIGRSYSFPCDVYSWAMLAFAVITDNFFPFGYSINELVLMKKVSKDPYFRPKINTQQFQECKFLIPVIKKNWSFDPKDRNTFSELLKILKKPPTPPRSFHSKRSRNTLHKNGIVRKNPKKPPPPPRRVGSFIHTPQLI